MTLLYAALLLLGISSEPAATSAPPQQEGLVLPAGKDGRDAASAIKVNSVDEEYAIIRRLGLKPKVQSLMMVEGRPYDMIRVLDPQTGRKRDVWFDIGSFFGKDLGF